MKTPDSSTDFLTELVDCLEQKGKSLEAFLALTFSLKERLLAQEWSGVDKIVKQRQDLIFGVDQINVRIQVLQSKHPLDLERLPDVQRKKIAELLNTISDVSEKAQVADKECMDRMTEWRDETRSRMSKMRGSSKAVHGYAQKPIRPPKFLDVRR